MLTTDDRHQWLGEESARTLHEQASRLAATYQALTARQVRETAAKVFSVEPTIATVLPEE